MLFISLAGCGSLLPSAKQTTKSQWKSFEEAKKTVEAIIPSKTTVEDMKKMGISPFAAPNIKTLTYLDIIQRFMLNPSIKKEDLEDGIRSCIEAKGRCYAYEVLIKNVYSKRYGSVFLDLFNFRRNTKTYGWEFDAIIVIVDNVAVYKLVRGSPEVDESREVKNPLGPLQDATDIIQNITAESLK